MAYRSYFCWDVSKIIIEYIQDKINDDDTINHKTTMNELVNKFFTLRKINISIPCSYNRLFTFLLEIKEQFIKGDVYPNEIWVENVENKNTRDAVVFWLVSNYYYKVTSYMGDNEIILLQPVNGAFCYTIITISNYHWYSS